MILLPLKILLIYLLIGAIFAFAYGKENRKSFKYLPSVFVGEILLMWIGWALFVVMALRKVIKGEPK